MTTTGPACRRDIRRPSVGFTGLRLRAASGLRQ
jgi:hypothetical protein